MGRGRAKAKQTKVARELKYYSPDTDLSALERELKEAQGSTEGEYSAEDVEEAENDDRGDPGTWAASDR